MRSYFTKDSKWMFFISNKGSSRNQSIEEEKEPNSNFQ